MAWQLSKPIVDNKADFKRLFPGAYYAGDIGDTSHSSRVSDHNPDWNSLPSWVRAQDLGDGGGFQLPRFARWLLDSVRAGKYPEIQYIITRHPSNSGSYFGLFDRRYGWTRQTASGHDHHLHISYRKGYERRSSTIVADWYNHLNKPEPKKGPIEMLRLEIPKAFAFAENGTLLDGDAIVGATYEWTDASGSIPSFGGGVLAVDGAHGNAAPVKLWVEFSLPGGRKRQPDIWIGKGYNPQWPKLPKGCYGISLGRIKAEGSDETQPASVTLIWGAK